MVQTERIRVAVVGAGPAGLYAAEELARLGAQVDVFERLFAPFGSVRYRSAPDHQHTKRRAALPEHVFTQPGVRFFGNVTVGEDLSVDELEALYDQVLIATGSASTKNLGIPGEARPGSLSASDVIAWYNGHPDGPDTNPSLQSERAVVIGMGDTALDVARILTRHHLELEPTDITSRALRALKKSRVREVVLLGRRGPDQAAFGVKELEEVLDLVGVQVGVEGLSPELRSREATPCGAILRQLPSSAELTAPRRIVFRFCSSAIELLGEGTRGPVEKVRYELNELVETPSGTQGVGSGSFGEIEAGLVVRATGFVARPLAGVPFCAATRTIPNDRGRVLDSPGGSRLSRLATVGSVQRGRIESRAATAASARETAAWVFEEARAHRARGTSSLDVAEQLTRKGVRFLAWADWERLDQFELEQGQALGRVRLKLLQVTEAWRALDHAHSGVRASPRSSSVPPAVGRAIG